MKYKYTDPVDKGYTKFKTPKKFHNELFPNRKENIFGKIDSYYKPTGVLFHYTPNLLGKIVITLLLPYALIMHGLSAFGDICEEYADTLKPKQRGAFTGEEVRQHLYNGKVNGKFVALEELFHEQHGKG